MKMWVTLGRKKAQADAFVRGGRFRSGPLYAKAPVITRSQPLEIYAMFNGAWQPESVLSLVGDGGQNLHGNLFKLKDPDVIDSDKILDATFTVALPPVRPEITAISIVKHPILTVPGRESLQLTSKRILLWSHNQGPASHAQRDGAQLPPDRISTM